MNRKGAKVVVPQHIEAGIKKYEGKESGQLNELTKSAGLNYAVYIFKDGRVLLVLPKNMGGLLYPNEEAFYAALELD